jgi:Holliday junction DNA helicase RuvB
MNENSFQKFLGKENIIKNIMIYIKSSKLMNKSLDHILIYGPPGTGKTTLASMISNEMQVSSRVVQGPGIANISDVLSIIYNIKEKDILIIEEIDCIDRKCFEMFYNAIENFYVSVSLGKDLSSKIVKMNIPKFTLIGLTNKLGDIPQPLIDRFPIIFKLDYYDDLEIDSIVEANLKSQGISVNSEMSKLIRTNSRGNPRICVNLIKRIKDYINNGIIDNQVIEESLGLSESGLNNDDINYLKILKDHSKSLSLKTLSSMLDIELTTVQNNIEPFLLKKALITKSSSGRHITEKGLKILNKI